MDVLEVQEMIRRMQIVHWVVMLANMMFCLCVTILTTRLIGRVRKEHDSTCEQIRREGMVEIDRLIEIINVGINSTRIHKEYAADQERTIENLKAEREESAKRILSLEDVYRAKCKEAGAMNWEINAGRDVRAAAFELCEMLDQFVKGMDEARAKNLFEPETFQPKQPEDQTPKPTCDN